MNHRAGRLRGGLARRLSPNRRGVLAILGGTAGGQALALVSAPVLSRLYSPSDFGLFTVLASLAAIVGTVAALRFELAVPLPERERDAQGLVALGLMSTGLTFVLTSVLAAAAGSHLARAFNQPHLMTWLWCVPVIAAVMGAYLVLNQLAVRQRRYGAIGRRNLLQAVAMVATQVAAGLTDLKAGGLVLGLGVGQATSAVSLVNGSGLFTGEAREGRQRHRLIQIARRYRRFPLLLAPSGLLNVLGLQLPVILIAYWYGGSTAGWLGLTQRVLSLPVMLVGTAIAQVYIAELARASRDDLTRASRLFVVASQRLLVFAGAAALVLMVVAPSLFGLIFGARWTTSGEYAQALAVGLAAQLVAVPVSQTLIVFERQTTQLGWDAGRLALTAGAVSVSHVLGGSALTSIWTYGVSSAVAYTGSWALSLQTIRRTQPISSPT